MAIKLLIGGSPCTHWSIAQTKNRETKAEGLGWELFRNYLIAKDKFKPDFFLYENNKSAAQAIKDQIAEELGVGTDPNVRFTYINSALVSAQNRQRFYVTNFGDIEQPADRGIVLKDILQGNTDREKSRTVTSSIGRTTTREYFKKNQNTMAFEPVNVTGDGKSKTIRASCYKDGIRNLVGNEYDTRTCVAEPVNTTKDGKSQTIKAQYQQTSPRNICCYKSTFGASGVAEPVGIAQRGRYTETGKEQHFEARDDDKTNALTTVSKDCMVAEPVKSADNLFRKFGSKGKIVSPNEKTGTLLAAMGAGGGNGIYTGEAVRVGSMPRPNGELSTSQAMRVYAHDAKSVNLVANGGGMGAKTGLYAIPVEEKIEEHPVYATPIEWDEQGEPIKAISGTDGKTYTVYKVENGEITIKGEKYPIKLADGYWIIRKLTVVECARLQTMPDDYCKAVSDSQAYKALGNGWTAEVIIHLLEHALKDVPRDTEIIVLSLYDGIATGRYCLEQMGFTNIKYYAYEIDKYPIMVAMDNYPDIIQCGDAFVVRNDDWKPPQTRGEWLRSILEV